MSENFHNEDNNLTVPSQKPVPHEASIPAPGVAPIYSTRHYSRQPPPPPPPLRESAARERVKRRRVNGKTGTSEWAWVVMAAAMFGVILIISVSTLLFVRASQANQEVLPTASFIADLPTPVVAYQDFAGLGEVTGDTLVLPDGSSIALVPWDGKSRFTMVLAGLDRRPGETGLGYRTDSMMLVSLDPVTQSIGILSVPRDLYVQIPGYSQLQRVNTPMVFGESQRPGYGSQLLMQTLQLNLGIRVHDYMLVDFDAVITMVDVIGGIDVDNPETINDRTYPNMYYGYDPFYLPAGRHHLNGYDALRYARTRHGSSDIQRGQRQQQVIMAIRDKVLSLDMIPQLIIRSPEIWANMSDNIATGLSLEQIIQLGLYAKDIPTSNIKHGVIDYRYLRSYETDEGAQVLIPNRATLGELMVEVFGENYNQ